MLSQSSIPASRAFVGKATDIRFPVDKFDFIFLLGVTTYQTPVELNDTFQFIQRRLAPDGTAVLSFTNGSSIDYVFRNSRTPIHQPERHRSSFTIYAYHHGTVADVSAGYNLHLMRLVYLNYTFSPFNTLLPRSSVLLSKWLRRNCPALLLPLCSADFLAFFEDPSR
jgi:SAM-dependent methyltransferase